MQEYFKLVFDDEGRLRDDAHPLAVRHIRQVLYLCYKLELPYRPREENAVIASFLENEKEAGYSETSETAALTAAASYVLRTVFNGYNPKDIGCRHGPGAVATGERLDEKWEFSRLYNSIHQVYPYYDYFIVSKRGEIADRRSWYKSLQRLDSGTAKVVLVPKDSRGPRLISAEPLEYMWLQQGLGRSIMHHLESFWMTRGCVNFTNQEINQKLALESSKTKEYATIDLKDASDRVSLQLVRSVFAQCKDLLKSLEALRTTGTHLPNGELVPLMKYAPMGSALCFPVMATCLWSLSVAAISREKRMQPTLVGRRIFVYGDDLIIPVDWYPTIREALTSVGLRFNERKSFSRGSFRESCGVDAFNGVDVTPIRLRTLWTRRPSDASAYASYIETANHLGKRGYARAQAFLVREVEKVYGPVPHGIATSPFPCWEVSDYHSACYYNRRRMKSRWNGRSQRFEFRVNYLSSRKIPTTLDSWPRLLRGITSPVISGDPSVNVVPRSTKISRRWSGV
jgi:hypothetical protein